MLVRRTGDIVAFQALVEDQPPDAGDRRTVVAGGVAVIVQTADSALRDQIAATVHEVDVDAAGCPVVDPVFERPEERPPAGTALEVMEEPESITACKYAVHVPGVGTRVAPLLASRRFDGQSAADLVEALVDAPIGGGPDAPETCLPEYSYGDEVIVLTVRHTTGSQRVVVRYSGCDYHGIDDGTVVRRLARAAMEPLSSDALAVLSGYSRSVAEVLNTPQRQ